MPKVIKDIWIFIAYKKQGVPMLSKLFSDFDEMKTFSSQHSAQYKSPTYSSTYLKLTDKSFLCPK